MQAGGDRVTVQSLAIALASPLLFNTRKAMTILSSLKPTLRRTTAIAAAVALTFSTAKPARSQAQLLLPAACATGVGCVLVGTVVVAGIVYYVWQNNQTGQQYRMPIEDPEAEMERMGGQTQSETVTAGTRSRALELCRSLAAGRTLQEVRHFRDNQWECIFY